MPNRIPRPPVLAALLLLLAFVRPTPAGVMSVDRDDDGKLIRIHLNPPMRSSVALVEAVDDATGRVAQTLYAGPVTPGQTIMVTKASGVGPGSYHLRYRDDINLVPDGAIEPPPELKRHWLNPTDIVIQDHAIYVMDAGFAWLEDPANRPVERDWKPTTGAVVHGKYFIAQSGYVYVNSPATTTTILIANLTPADQKLVAELDAKRLKYYEVNAGSIYKFDRNGHADLSFGDHGRIPTPDNSANIRGFGVDHQGLIYSFSSYHNVIVLPPNGGKPIRSIGGWDDNPAGPKSTPHGALALGPGNRIYLPNPYSNMKIYDRTKPDYAGLIARVDLPGSIGMDRSITADRDGRIYEIGANGQLHKFTDDGKTVKTEYASSLDDKLMFPTGPSASGRLVWVACHGPGFGPYWDSGGGGEVVLYWDDINEKQLRLVTRFGTPGTAADGLEFLNASSVAMTPDHRHLLVAEDGVENKEGPPGNGRVRRFVIKENLSEELELKLPPWP